MWFWEQVASGAVALLCRPACLQAELLMTAVVGPTHPFLTPQDKKLDFVISLLLHLIFLKCSLVSIFIHKLQIKILRHVTHNTIQKNKISG